MFKQPIPPRKRYSPRNDVLIILAVAIVLFTLVFTTNVFLTIIQIFDASEHEKIDEVFVAFSALNFVFIALLIRRTRALTGEVSHSQETARHWQQERLMLLTLIDHIPDYIFVKDRDGRFVVSNAAHARAVQLSPKELIGKTAFEVFPPKLAAQFHADDEAIMLAGKSLINVERTTVNDIGHERTVLTTKVRLNDSDGHVTGLVGISRDITDRKQKEEQALELAGERERVKMMTSFTRDAAHDFRTPLSTINASLYLLSRSADPERQAEHTRRIEAAVVRVTRLLDGLTTMTQLDSLTQLDLHVVDVNDVIQAVVAGAVFTAGHPLLPLTLDLDTHIQWVCGAAYELRRVFANLIDNAIQNTPEDSQITVRTFQQGDEVVVEVRDSGTGISPSDLPHIFDRFYRTDQARSSETGGIGLGLSIARKIVELHGGRLEAESELGVGSVFRVALPISNTPDLGASCDITPAA